MAHSHRLETPPSNRGHRPEVDVLAHAPQEACRRHIASFINEDLGNHQSVETGDVEPGQVRRGVSDLPGHIDVAADPASGRSFDVARRRAPGDRRLCRGSCRLRTPASECQCEPHSAPRIPIHVVLDTEWRGLATQRSTGRRSFDSPRPTLETRQFHRTLEKTVWAGT